MTNESFFTKLPDYIRHGLKKVASEQGFTEGMNKFEFEDFSKKGDGFMGDFFKVFIREQGREELVVLCKRLPSYEIRKQYSIGLFNREVQAYNEVLPMLKKFQTDKGISDGDCDGFWNAPKSYYAYCDVRKLEGVIIMEDLAERHFRMCNKYEPVDYEHTRLLMVQLGRLHALSFALKDQQPKVFERFKEFKDPLGRLIEHEPRKRMTKMFNETCERAIALLDDDDKLSRTKMESIRGVVTDLYREDTKASEAEPYAVLGHGDCWINNMMYTYKNDDPTDICLIDWQLCRYVSPVLDLVYFIFISTDEALRANHYEDLMQVYYKSLSDFLRRLGGDADRQFPQSAFQKQLERFGRFGLLISFLVLPVICTENEELPEDMGEHMEKAHKAEQSVDGSSRVQFEFSKTDKADAMFRKRMRGMIMDVVRLGYLQ